MTGAAALPAGVRPFVEFGQLLRAHGFPVATDQTVDFLKAIGILGPRSFRHIYWAGRAIFAPSPERLAEFDTLFNALFRDDVGATSVADENSAEEVPAGESGRSELEPVAAGAANQSGTAATGAEVLSLRNFEGRAPCDRLRALQRNAMRLVPHRRGFRHAAVKSGRKLDLRRSLSRMVRGGADASRPAWTARRWRVRRVLLLIDISGSMKAHTDDYLHFAHVLTQALPSVETFSFGTRLTRLTRSLHHRNLDRALAEVAPSVADWSGGTRIADSIGAFLAVPRFSRASRGALVVVLSDGLERGDPAAMAHAVRRLAARSWRLAWLTPLAADPAFRPETAALNAILDIVDHLGDGSGIDPLCGFVEGSARLGRIAPATGRAAGPQRLRT
jgi:uncharacterized protein with von Willebrand factor type A (vWA) domain